jgi:hypothetical protein
VGRSKDFPDEKYTQKEILQKVAETKASYTAEDVEKMIGQKQKEMEAAAKNLDFIKAKLRDEIAALKHKKKLILRFAASSMPPKALFLKISYFLYFNSVSYSALKGN